VVQHHVTFFFFQICDVPTLPMNQKRNKPNLITIEIRKYKNLGILAL
jgi:hypothetical protein